MHLRRKTIPRRYRKDLFLFLYVCDSFISYNSHHKSCAQGERIALVPKGPARGQKTRRGIEGEDPAAPGIERFFLPERSSKRKIVRKFVVCVCVCVILKKKTPETVCGSLGACLPVNVC